MELTRNEVFMMSDGRYEEMMATCIASIRANSGAPADVEFSVYDLGLSDGGLEWCKANNVTVRSLDGVERIWTPANRFNEQWNLDLASFWFYTQKDVSDRIGPNGMGFAVDPDMICVGPFWEDVVTKASKGVVSLYATPEEETLTTSTLYLRALPNGNASEIWKRAFGEDYSETPAYNGVNVFFGDVWKKLYKPCMSFIQMWAANRQTQRDFNSWGLGQLALSVCLLDEPHGNLPLEMNFTRRHWGRHPELIRSARMLHMTGPIKEWEPGFRIHPMGNMYSATKRKLIESGALRCE